MSKNPRLLEELRADFSKSEQLSGPERAMLAYAAKLTRSPEKVEEDDLNAMRTSGLDDKAILEINQIAGYFAYANRLASGLGVELEEFWHHASAIESSTSA